MNDSQKLKGIRKALKDVIAYPEKGHPRRTKDGYPSELAYDEFAYKRIVNSFRDALKEILEEYK